MRGAPEIKGWCPGALAPMISGDGLLMRAKIVGSRLTLAQALEIAEISREQGNGLLDLSQRAQLQMRGLREETRVAAQARLKSIDLLAPDAATESRLNIVASPLASHAADNANEIAASLARAIADDETLKSLPAKFLFLVDDGSAPGLRDVDADIRIESRGETFAVIPGGARDLAFIAPPRAATGAAIRLARAFIELRASRAFEPRRMGALIEAIGVEPLLSVSGLKFEPYRSSCFGARPSDWLGARQNRQYAHAGFAAPFGRLRARDLSTLAETAARVGGTEFRLTPWRAILAPTQTLEQAERVIDEARKLGLIVDASDARLAIAACPGAPECSQAGDRREAASTPSLVSPERCFPRGSVSMSPVAPRAAPSHRPHPSRLSPMAMFSTS